MNIIKGGEFQVFPDFGHDGGLIFKAATTCYDSETKTSKDNNGIIRMLKNSGHTAMLEFMWIVLKVNHDEMIYGDDSPFFSLSDARNYIQDEIHPNSKHISITSVNGELYVYGNGRGFYELMKIHGMLGSPSNFIMNMHKVLCDINYELFHDSLTKEYEIIKMRDLFTVMDYNTIMNKENGFPHAMRWICLKMEDVSRGLTHELVRHRVFSFAQRSTRYVNHSDLKVVMWTDELPAGLPVEVHHFFTKCEELYSKMIEAKVHKDIARQILPTATCADICIAGTLDGFANYFKLRTHTSAHREIRDISNMLLSYLSDEGIV